MVYHTTLQNHLCLILMFGSFHFLKKVQKMPSLLTNQLPFSPMRDPHVCTARCRTTPLGQSLLTKTKTEFARMFDYFSLLSSKPLSHVKLQDFFVRGLFLSHQSIFSARKSSLYLPPPLRSSLLKQCVDLTKIQFLRATIQCNFLLLTFLIIFHQAYRAAINKKSLKQLVQMALTELNFGLCGFRTMH